MPDPESKENSFVDTFSTDALTTEEQAVGETVGTIVGNLVSGASTSDRDKQLVRAINALLHLAP